MGDLRPPLAIHNAYTYSAYLVTRHFSSLFFFLHRFNRPIAFLICLNSSTLKLAYLAQVPFFPSFRKSFTSTRKNLRSLRRLTSNPGFILLQTRIRTARKERNKQRHLCPSLLLLSSELEELSFRDIIIICAKWHIIITRIGECIRKRYQYVFD